MVLLLLRVHRNRYVNLQRQSSCWKLGMKIGGAECYSDYRAFVPKVRDWRETKSSGATRKAARAARAPGGILPTAMLKAD